MELLQHLSLGLGVALAPQNLLYAFSGALVGTIQARARELKAQGRSADEAATTLQQELQNAHPGWPRANGVLALARAAYAEAPPGPAGAK